MNCLKLLIKIEDSVPDYRIIEDQSAINGDIFPQKWNNYMYFELQIFLYSINLYCYFSVCLVKENRRQQKHLVSQYV